MLAKANLHFADETPDREIKGVREIRFKSNGDSYWTYHDPKGNGLAVTKFKVGQLAYIQIGVE